MKMTLAQAIGRMEGFGADAHNRPTRNNNPGDIEFGPFAMAHGAVGSDGRFARFPDAATGFDCLQALLESPHYKGLTVSQVIAKYAPSNENDTARYIHDVCLWTGLTPDTVIDVHLR